MRRGVSNAPFCHRAKIIVPHGGVIVCVGQNIDIVGHRRDWLCRPRRSGITGRAAALRINQKTVWEGPTCQSSSVAINHHHRA
jgi:hypothetical protein